ncbi:MAG: T9SS type A sorting domain-containing protein [Sphingobacteriales bacterium]|nr:MAG: T9SS type A sorting domain-containing protein [Sphingobacteriales bacterium]
MNSRNLLIVLFLATFGFAGKATAQCPNPLPGGTYTINAGAAASTSNFQSFAAAVTAMNCGVSGAVTFNVVAGSGPYTEQVTLNAITGTSAANRVTFNGNGNTLTFSGTTSNRATIKFNGADFVTFNNLTINATNASFSWGVHVTNNSDNNTVNNCTINSVLTGTTISAAAGIVMNGSNATVTTALTAGTDCDNNIFSNNTINGGYHGIILVGTAVNRSSGNKILNNTIKDFYYYGVRIDNQNDILVDSNDISRPTRADAGVFYGVSVDATFKALVTRNRIHNPADADLANTSTQYGLYIAASDPTPGNENIFSNNLIYNFTRGGTQYGIYNSSSDSAWYYNNTIVLNDAANTGTSIARAIYQTGIASGIKFENNIVQMSRGGNGENTVIYLATPTTSYTSDRNIYIMGSTGSGFNRIGYYNGNGYTTLLDWQIGVGKDANSTDVSPVFANPSAGNYAPTNAEVNNIGSAVGVAIDITGASRSTTTPDVGAYEFSPAACTAPPTTGNTTVSATSICGGGYLTLSLTGNSSGAGQTYQWQRSTTSGGTYTNVGSAQNWTKLVVNPSVSYYYRAAVKCGTNTQYSTPLRVSVSSALAPGTYTINSAMPTGSGNFNTFSDAVDALRCGITGAVTINVANGTYNEQIDIPVIPGASASARVTIKSAMGNAANVTIQDSSFTIANNYVVRLSGTSFLTFKGITIRNKGITHARCFEITGAAASDSIMGCVLTGPSVTTNSTNTAKFFGDNLTGVDNVLDGCTVQNGSHGIFISGTGTSNLVDRWVVQNNTVTNAYSYSVYFYYTSNLKARNNTAVTNSSGTHYGLYSYYADSAAEITGNKITATGTGIKYGIYYYNADGTSAVRGLVANNVVLIGNSGSTSTTRGLSIYQCSYQRVYNNTVNVLGASATACLAGYFYFNDVALYTNNEIRNNILSNTGGGYAMYVYNPALADNNSIDYNNLYTTGAKLVDRGTPVTDYTDLTAWRAASQKDMNSISYDPGFTNNTSNLVPDPAKAASWSVNGRGVHLAINNKDINGNTRATTTATGVPDIGAYEFTPTSTPPAATASPATPSAGTTQYFTFGQDTVAVVSWATGSTVPSAVTVRQYSGTLPPQILTSSPGSYMYFYTDINAAPGTYDYTPSIYYKQPWMGIVASETDMKMIKKLGSGSWVPYNFAESNADVARNIITSPGRTTLGLFSGIDNDILFVAKITPSNLFLCPGGNSTLTANLGSGITYKWKLDGGYIPGATSITHIANVPGTYIVEETRGTSVVESEEVLIGTISAPAANITSAATVFCIGGSEALNANIGTGLTYQWKLDGGNIPGATSSTHQASAVGAYTVVVTNPGCSTTSAPVSITSAPLPMAVIAPDTTVMLCPGSMVTMNGTVPVTGLNIAYQWQLNGADIPGANVLAYTTNIGGNYALKLTSSTCPATVSPGTNIVNTTAPSPVISASGFALTTGTFNSYQWYKDGVAIPGANNFTYTVTENGTYTVEVSNGGCTSISEAYIIRNVGFDDLSLTENRVSVYPNPATDVVFINAKAQVNVVLMAADGRTMTHTENAKQLDISSYPEGVYMLRVMDKNNILIDTIKIIKSAK